jgi:Tol biopolymer transport system component
MPSRKIEAPRRLGALALAAASLAAWGGGAPDADLPAGPIQRLSTTTSGAPASASSSTCALSADGRLALFFSDAANLVAGDTNGRADLFLRHLETGAIQRVTTQSDGAQIAAGGSCLGTTMTPDGRLVAFNTGETVFVKNTLTGQLVQASPPAGTVAQVRGYFGGVLSDDGRSIVFLTVPEQLYVGGYDFVNLVPARLMVRDLIGGGLQTLNTDNGVVAEGQVIGTRFAMSPDGTRVAFVSSSAGLVPGDVNGRPDVFVRDLVGGGTTLVSSTSEGGASDAVQYWRPTFVSDTRVAFSTSGPSSLGAPGLYLKDLATGVLRLLIGDAEGGADGMLSGDARQVVFPRLYSGFDSRVFVRDLASGQEALVSAGSSGRPANGSSTGAVISRDGTTVIFGSSARNLVNPRPPAGVFQLYAKTIAAAGVD